MTERSTFKALDPAQLGGLSDAQRDAIARTIAAEGPALIRSGHTERLLGTALLGGAMAAAAALVFIVQSRLAETQAARVVLSIESACEGDAAPTPITHEERGRSIIEIGSRIRAVTSGTTPTSIVSATPCNTRLALNEGTLTLQARHLGGGTVWIETPQGQVRATGSLMRIVSLAESTSVSVVEGEVVMRTPHGAESVGAGRAITVGPAGVERFALSGQDRKSVIGALEEAAQAVQEPPKHSGLKPQLAPPARTRAPIAAARAEAQPEVPAARLLAQAETLWRKGDHAAARLAFRAAAQGRGAVGEAAWVRLARLELAAGSSEQALKALKARKRRAGNGTLGAEALWLEAEALVRAGRSDEAVKTAELLLRDYPGSPQARAARQVIAAGR